MFQFFTIAFVFSLLIFTIPTSIAQTNNNAVPVLTDIFGTTNENNSSKPISLGGNSPSESKSGNPNSGRTNSTSDNAADNTVDRLDEAVTFTKFPDDILRPFGIQLFDQNNLIDRTIGVNPSYTIKSGDRILVRAWGAWSFENTLTVDTQGNIFVPEIGPIQVAGLRNAALTGHVRSRMGDVFTKNVSIYTNLLGTQPIRLYVTGAVPAPGYYPGESSDTILYFLSRAGGVDPFTGSFRNINIIRSGKIIETIDLYRFLLNGIISRISFQPGDTIFVHQRQSEYSATGEVRNNYSYELPGNNTFGRDLIDLARPTALASHVLLSGIRDGKAFSTYLNLKNFSKFPLRAGDKAVFERDLASETITISVVGRSSGASQFIIPQTTSLADLLRLVKINPKSANIDAIHLKRKSVAERQGLAIQRSLYELQRSVLTGSSESSSDSQIRIQEASMVERFVSKVRAAEPQGRVVITGANWDELSLENGDEIVIPLKTDLVLVSGEVKFPQSLVWRENWNLQDYVNNAGGVSNRGDIDKLLILHADGSASTGGRSPQKGDHIMILPEDDTKYFAIFKDIVEIIYRVALSSAIVLSVND